VSPVVTKKRHLVYTGKPSSCVYWSNPESRRDEMKEAPTQRHELETPYKMSTVQLERFARFLETHPGFYPELQANGVVSGFRVGGCFLSIDEMDKFISIQPRFAAHEAALLLVVPHQHQAAMKTHEGGTGAECTSPQPRSGRSP
jgi:hypothetical protein